jgi:hypothetical protein
MAEVDETTNCLCCIAHTVSQRIRTLKKIPVELVPLGAYIFGIKSCWKITNIKSLGVVLG